MSSKIRSLVKADLDRVATIANQFQNNSWSKDTFADCLKANYLGWVVTDEQEVIQGFLVILCNAQECQILNIGVAPEQQRCGYGRQLLEHLFNFLKTHPVKQILLEVRESNQAARSLYEKMGFQQVGLRKNYYPAVNGRENALVLACLYKTT